MFRNLKAIEIAEGALLADIAVVFQLIAAFLPVGGGFLHTLVFIVFAILVLRRGMYVSVMGMCTALFLICVLIGPHGVTNVLLEGMGGIFLGVMMKRRFPHIPLILIGAITGSFVLYCLILLLGFLTGLTVGQLVLGLHQIYDTGISFVNLLAAHLGLGIWWKSRVYPGVASLSLLAFTYWWATFYLLLFLFLCPVVFVVYLTTNLFVRLLGYDVRPFPDGRVGKLLRRASRRLIKIGIKRGIIGRTGARA
ncbi:MAG TPA: DUF2232 domain-containing protein [Ktedonobacteraceae bacterium]|nr:DUF2232 domain-containing protein [Ktedonobacteraceae bacterium]